MSGRPGHVRGGEFGNGVAGWGRCVRVWAGLCMCAGVGGVGGVGALVLCALVALQDRVSEWFSGWSDHDCWRGWWPCSCSCHACG